MTTFAPGSDGSVPGSNPLTVGNIKFPSWSVPDELEIGAVEQLIAVINLLGGGRVVQALGVQPKQITFKAELWGSGVASIIQDMRAYVVSGQPQTVTFLTESWSCIVKEFIPTYKFQWRSGYEIVLEPITSTSGTLTSTSIVTVDQQIGQMNGQIQAVVNQIVSQAESEGFSSSNQLWQDYLVALGILYTLNTQQV